MILRLLAITTGLALVGASPVSASQQRITWHGCQQGPDDADGKELDSAGAQCADIALPLDYSRPHGRTITVAISRLKAADTAHRIGTLFINTGGPGAPGVPDVLPVHEWMKDAGSWFDLIGMDPRFIGRSTPLDCDWPVGTWIRSAGPDRRGFDEMVAFEADLAAQCGRTQADVLPYATTRNTARDMDAIRAALGEPKLSYLGYSYGTYLGSAYTQMFPHRADRVVLDSAIDPRKYGGTMLRDAAAKNEAGLRDWASWVASRHATYSLGNTTDEVLTTVDNIRPQQIAGYNVDEHLIPMLLMDALDDDRDASNAELADTVRVLATGAEPTPELLDTLKFALTGDESEYGSVQASILCDDVAVPRDPQWYWRDIQAHRTAEPRFGPLLRNISPCAFWPTALREQPTRVGNNVPALIVASTGDPRTPYEHGKAMHGLLTGSRMVTLQGARIHAVYGNYGNACVDGAVAAYFRDGVLPGQDLTCVK